MKRIITLILLLAVVTNAVGFSAVGNHSNLGVNGKEYYISLYNVSIQVNEDASLNITEVIRFKFISGEFTYAFRYIYYEKLDDVKNVKVGEITGSGITWYTRGKHSNGFVIERNMIEINIKWFYPKTVGGSERTFIIKYQATSVVDAVDDYNLVAWTIVPYDNPNVKQAIAKVRIPRSFTRDKVTTTPEPVTFVSKNNETIISFSKFNIESGTPFFVKVKFPKFINPNFSYRRLFNDNLFLIIILTASISLILFIAIYIKVGRGEPVPRSYIKSLERKYREILYMEEPVLPMDVKPFEAAILVDGKVSSKAWAILIFDLAARGFLLLHQKNKRYIDVVIKPETLEMVSEPVDGKLEDYEIMFLQKLDKLAENSDSEIGKSVSINDISSKITYGEFKDVEDIIVRKVVDKQYFKFDFRKLKGKWLKLFLYPLIPFVVLLGYGFFNYMLGLFVLGFEGAIVSVIGAIAAHEMFTTRTKEGSILAKEAEIISNYLVKKLEMEGKIDKYFDDFKNMVEKALPWILITRFYKRKVLPVRSSYRSYGYWLPAWLIIPTHASKEPISLENAVKALNDSLRIIGRTFAPAGGGRGGFGGGIAGGGGVGAG